jgi:hypothetical protein
MGEDEAEVFESTSIEVRQNDSITSLDGYYSVRLGLTGEMESDITKLYDFYTSKGFDKVSSDVLRDTLYEYISLLNARGLFGAEVVAEKISMVSRKSSKDKKNLSYLIGCIRTVLEHGISATGSVMEKRLLNAFESKYSIRLSAEGIFRLLGMATTNSTAETVLTIMENDINIEGLILDRFEYLLMEGKDKY